MNLEGKTAAITGAAAGLGREIAMQISQAEVVQHTWILKISYFFR